MAGIALTGIVNGIIVPHYPLYSSQNPFGFLENLLYYAGIFGISILAGVLFGEIGRGLLGFLASYSLALVLTFLALVLPGLTGIISETAAQDLAISFVFAAFFPFGLFIGLVGGILGAASSDV